MKCKQKISHYMCINFRTLFFSTRSEDIEKKLKDAEQREEALVKRITEKDKTNTKLK